MLKLNEYVSKLTDEQRKSIIESFVIFETEGFIGDAYRSNPWPYCRKPTQEEIEGD